MPEGNGLFAKGLTVDPGSVTGVNPLLAEAA